MNSTANTTSPISSMLDRNSAKAPDRPRCDSNAAMPRPAAMPAMGPSQRDMPLLAAVPAAAVPAAAPVAGAVERLVVVAVDGVVAWRCWVILLDWRPKLPPPPMRRASASNDTASMAVPATAISAAASNRVIPGRDILRDSLSAMAPLNTGAPPGRGAAGDGSGQVSYKKL